MLHTVRPNETFEDIAYIYNTDEEAITQYNCHEESLPPVNGNCVWVPCEKKICFYNENMPQICEFLSVEEDELLKLNHISASKLKKDAALITPLTQKRDFGLSNIFNADSLNESFAGADAFAGNIDTLFINAYDVNENSLNLPYDYPAINACLINAVEPMFVIDDPHKFSDENILMQLRHDLLFKDYKGALLIARSASDIKDAETIFSALYETGFKLFLSAPLRFLKNLQSELLYGVYYMSEKNIFDFTSFFEEIKEFAAMFENKQKGIFFERHAADINRKSMMIANPTPQMLAALIKKRNIDEITFDETSQLCFFGYDEDEQRHNVIYEDMRSFYSKMSAASHYKIKNALVAANPADVKIYEGILRLLS